MGGTSPSTWVVKARELFFGRLSSLMNKKHDDDDDDDDIAAADEESLEDCIALSENETAIMKLIACYIGDLINILGIIQFNWCVKYIEKKSEVYMIIHYQPLLRQYKT
jgi:hypothetical protein